MLKVGIIGCGGMGRLHGEQYNKHPKAKVIAVCDLVAERADSVGEQLGAKPYHSLDKMLEAEELDVVSVCTQPDKHVEPTIKALERGLHVLCEKPLAMTAKEANEMVSKAEENHCFLSVDFNRRFAPAYQRAKELVEKGELGNLCYLKMKLAQGGDPNVPPYFALTELQCHSLDMLRNFGGEVTEVSAYGVKPRSGTCYTTWAIALKFEFEHVGTLIGSWDTCFCQPIERLEVAGTKKYLVVDNVMAALEIHPYDTQDCIVWKPDVFHTCDFYGITIPNHIHAFVDAISKGEAPPVTGLDGLRSLQLIEAAIKSFEEGRSVKPY